MSVVDQLNKLQALDELEKQAIWGVKTLKNLVSRWKSPKAPEVKSSTTSASKETKAAPNQTGQTAEVKAPPSPAPETTKVTTPNSAPPTKNPEAPKVSTAETKGDKLKEWWSNDKNKVGVGMAATGITGVGIGLSAGGSSGSRGSGSSHF